MNRHTLGYVSLLRAAELCETGEWLTDTLAMGQISDSAATLRTELAIDDDTQREWLLNEVYTKVFEESNNAVNKLLLERFEYFIIKDPDERPSAMLEFRLRPNTVLKVGQAVPALFRGLALIYAVFTITPLPFVLKLNLGIQIFEIGQRLLQCWESIEDPDERLVFEAVFRLQGKRSGEILKLRDYPQTPWLLESDLEGIALEVGLEQRDVVKTLSGLQRRGILAQKDGRWSIAF